MLEKELDIYERRALEELMSHGYTEDEINRAASGLLSGTRLWPTTDGETIVPAWRWLEALRSIQEARDAILDGNIERARRKLAEGREWQTEAQMEPHAERGFRVLSNAKLGHEEVHGNADEKLERWTEYQRALEDILARRPHISLTEARRRVARKFGASYRTILRHTKEPNQQ